MADDQEEPRRARRTRRPPEGRTRPEQVAQEPAPEPDGSGGQDDGDDHREDGDGGRVVPARDAARRAAQQVAEFTGRSPESVVSIDRADGGWTVGVEVVETRRIPDTQDVLAIYEVRVDQGGELLSYRRTRRYARGELDGRCR